MRRAAILVAVVGLLALPAATSAGGPITVFAAASLTQVFPRIDKSPHYSFAGSDQLALQIQQGAPADVYAAASPKYTELLYHNGLVARPAVFATNRCRPGSRRSEVGHEVLRVTVLPVEVT